MGQLNIFKRGDNRKLNFSRSKTAGHKENNMVPVKLSGVVIPWERGLEGSAHSSYKLICLSGAEYHFVEDEEWTNVLKWYSWKEVNVIGLLQTADLLLIPQKVYPKGPKGEKELTGILVPCHQEHQRQIYKFKLCTQTNEYFLSVKRELFGLAEKAGWEEVTVKGTLGDDGHVLEVEKLYLSQSEEVEVEPAVFRDPIFDIETYLKLIDQRGKLEPALDYVGA